MRLQGYVNTDSEGQEEIETAAVVRVLELGEIAGKHTDILPRTNLEDGDELVCRSDVEKRVQAFEKAIGSTISSLLNQYAEDKDKLAIELRGLANDFQSNRFYREEFESVEQTNAEEGDASQ